MVTRKKREEGLKLTEKKMANRRFRRTEEAICAFMKRGRKDVSETARSVSMSRSTFYYHHQSMSDVVTDHRKYIMKKYGRLMRRILRPGARIRGIYSQLLMFILRERQIFLMFSEMGEREIFCQMVDRLRKKIEKTAKITSCSEKVFDLYRAEMVTVLEAWGRSGFLEEEMGQTLLNMMTITDEINGKFSKKIK